MPPAGNLWNVARPRRLCRSESAAKGAAGRAVCDVAAGAALAGRRDPRRPPADRPSLRRSPSISPATEDPPTRPAISATTKRAPASTGRRAPRRTTRARARVRDMFRRRRPASGPRAGGSARRRGRFPWGNSMPIWHEGNRLPFQDLALRWHGIPARLAGEGGSATAASARVIPYNPSKSRCCQDAGDLAQRLRGAARRNRELLSCLVRRGRSFSPPSG